VALHIHIANFDSRCTLCDGRIHEGDDIVNVDGEWVHAACAEEEGEEVDHA
jgi:hypothetical protein